MRGIKNENIFSRVEFASQRKVSLHPQLPASFAAKYIFVQEGI